MKIVKPLRFNPFTFSRNSTAKYLNEDGDYVDAAIDVLRIGYSYDINTDDLVFVGSIIEEGGINAIADSNNFDAWTKFGSPLPTITPNNATSPEGINNASLFAPSGLGNAGILYDPQFGLDGGVGIFTVFLKAVTTSTQVKLAIGANQFTFNINTDNYFVVDDNAYITPFPNGWFRCEVQATGFFPSAYIYAVGGKSFLMYGAQFEQGYATFQYIKRASSYIQQTGSSTVSISGTSLTRISGTSFSQYSPGQTITINNSNYVIATIAGANNMTLTTAPGATSSIKILSRTYREADIVVDQTPSLISSNIAEDDADVWSSGDSYVVDDLVMVLGEHHRVYRALTNNTNKFPPDHTNTASPDWLDTGATNRWRMFDMLVGAEKQSTATLSSGDIDVLVGVESYVTSVVLLNASGVTATIVMRNILNEAVYERSIDLLGTAMGIGWWEFFFGYRNGIKTIVLTDLPKLAPATIQVTIDGGGGVAGLGKLIIGDAIEIGCAKFGTTVGIIDFSRKERDAFGNNYILQRRYIDKVDYDIQIESDKVDDIKDILTSVRSTPAVYIGSENKFRSTVVFGFYRDFSIVIEGSRKSKCVISIEGI